MALTNGIYSLCAFDNYEMIADNSNASKSASNPQILYSYNGSYAQKFKVSDAESGKADEKKITNQDSGQSWYINKTTTLENQSIKQFPDGAGAQIPERSWEFIVDGRSLNINGVDYDCYNINSGADTTYSVDYTDAIKSSSNPLKLKASDSTSTKQSFVPFKTTFYQPSMTAPSIYIDGENNGRVNVARDTVESKTLTFNGGTNYQFRVQRQFLLHNTNNWVEDPYYYSPTNTKTDLGYGDVWSKNADGTNSFNMESANSNPTGTTQLYSEPYDSVKYIIEARQFSNINGNPWSGVLNSKTYYTCQKTQGSINGLRISAAGLILDYGTTAYRTIDNGELTFDLIMDGESILESPITATVGYSESSYLIDYGLLKHMPKQGDQITVDFKLTPNSNYLTAVILKETMTVTIAGGEYEPVITFTAITDFDLKLKIAEKDNKEFNFVQLSMIYEHDGNTIIQKIIDGTNEREAYFACPLNKEFELFCLIAKDNGTSFDKWGTKSILYTHESHDAALVLNSKTSEISFWTYNETPGNSFKKSKKPGTDSVSLKGKKYQSTYTDGSLDTGFTFSNLYMPNADEDIMERVLNDFYALVRTYRGEYFHGAITDVSYDNCLERGIVISISVSETTHTEDIALPD